MRVFTHSHISFLVRFCKVHPALVDGSIIYDGDEFESGPKGYTSSVGCADSFPSRGSLKKAFSLRRRGTACGG